MDAYVQTPDKVILPRGLSLLRNGKPPFQLTMSGSSVVSINVLEVSCSLCQRGYHKTTSTSELSVVRFADAGLIGTGARYQVRTGGLPVVPVGGSLLYSAYAHCGADKLEWHN